MGWLVLLEADGSAPLDLASTFDGDASYEVVRPSNTPHTLLPLLPLRPPARVCVRLAARADVDQCLALMNECLPAGHRPFTAGFVVNLLWRPDSYVLVASLVEQPYILVGCLTAALSAERTSLYLSSLSTAPMARRMGVARRLLASPLLPSQQKELRLHVSVHNDAARALYTSVGFREVGRSSRAYRYRDRANTDAIVLARSHSAAPLCAV